MNRAAFLTMRDASEFVTDYALAIPPLEALGWDVVETPWRDSGTDWDGFDAVYICTPWDYPDDPDRFLEVLATIEASAALLVNPLEIVHWNLEKSYLRDLEMRGADIVPSRWFDAFEPARVNELFESEYQRIVVKPLVGANAADTYVLRQPVAEELIDELADVFRERPFFVQPFIDSVVSEGEYSLFFLGGELSHAILKTPKPGDFRVQEEHGAEIRAVAPSDQLVSAAQRVLGLIEPQPMYARADFVRAADGRYLLMELELIEPSMYLRMETGAAERFARAFDQYARRRIE